jgi:dolichyl-phosphate beta-glucosyltransferase
MNAAAPAPQFPFSLSVVIPTYKEEARLPQTLDEILAYLVPRYREFEVLVVDDNSPDATPAIVRACGEKYPQVRLLTQPGRVGKGAALRRGCIAARCDYVLFMDADHATPIAEVENFFPHIVGRDVGAVAGVRTYQEGESRARRIVGLICQLLAHLIVFQKAVVDSQCGFKIFTSAAAARLFPYARVDGGMIDVELFFLMHRLGISCRYVPVSWANKAGSRINFLVCMVRDPLDMLRIRVRDIFGLYRTPLAESKQPWAVS